MNSSEQARKATVTTPGDREIHIERVFDAPRDRVFAVFTDPELIPRWWGPHGTEAVVEEMDVRSGGDWRFRIQNSDGTETGFRGTYREVTPPERIVQTFEWNGMPGYVSVETAEFIDLGEQTKVVSTSLFHTREERDGMIDSGMEGGLNETYERLDEVLAG
jgi:uncharacterized protein YndB with AHSA1/START domain